MEQINLYGSIKEGKLVISNRNALDIWTRNLPEGENIVVKFNVAKSYKSFRQVRLVYACFRKIMDKTGYDLNEVKYLTKRDQGLCASHEIEGEHVVFCKSISDFTKEEMSNFIMRMDKWSIDNLTLPLLTNEDIQFLKS